MSEVVPGNQDRQVNHVIQAPPCAPQSWVGTHDRSALRFGQYVGTDYGRSWGTFHGQDDHHDETAIQLLLDHCVKPGIMIEADGEFLSLILHACLHGTIHTCEKAIKLASGNPVRRQNIVRISIRWIMFAVAILAFAMCESVRYLPKGPRCGQEAIKAAAHVG